MLRAARATRHAGDLGPAALWLAGRYRHLVARLRRPLRRALPRPRRGWSRARPTRVPFYCPVNEISFYCLGRRRWRLSQPLRARPRLRAEGAAGPRLDRRDAGDPRRRSARPLRPLRSADQHRRRSVAARMSAWHAEGARQAQFQAWDMIAGRMWPQLGGAPRAARYRRRQLLLQQPVDPWRPADRRRPSAVQALPHHADRDLCPLRPADLRRRDRHRGRRPRRLVRRDRRRGRWPLAPPACRSRASASIRSSTMSAGTTTATARAACWKTACSDGARPVHQPLADAIDRFCAGTDSRPQPGHGAVRCRRVTTPHGRRRIVVISDFCDGDAAAARGSHRSRTMRSAWLSGDARPRPCRHPAATAAARRSSAAISSGCRLRRCSQGLCDTAEIWTFWAHDDAAAVAGTITPAPDPTLVPAPTPRSRPFASNDMLGHIAAFGPPDILCVWGLGVDEAIMQACARQRQDLQLDRRAGAARPAGGQPAFRPRADRRRMAVAARSRRAIPAC